MNFLEHHKWCDINPNKQWKLHGLQRLMIEQMLVQVTAYLGLCAVSPDIELLRPPRLCIGGAMLYNSPYSDKSKSRRC